MGTAANRVCWNCGSQKCKARMYAKCKEPCGHCGRKGHGLPKCHKHPLLGNANATEMLKYTIANRSTQSKPNGSSEVAALTTSVGRARGRASSKHWKSG